MTRNFKLKEIPFKDFADPILAKGFFINLKDAKFELQAIERIDLEVIMYKVGCNGKKYLIHAQYFEEVKNK